MEGDAVFTDATAPGLGAIAMLVPHEETLTVELPERARLPEAEKAVFDRTGIETIRQAPGVTETDLAARAGTRALERARVSPDDLDLVILLEGRRPQYLVASEATRLQREVGARRAIAFSVAGLGCVSVCAAFALSQSWLSTHPRAPHVLIAGGSRPISPRRYRHPVTILGDGGGAVLFTRESAAHLIDLRLETDGQFWDLFRVDYANTPPSDWAEICSDLREYSFTLAMASRNRFAEINRQMLSAAGLQLSDVDHFVMQNISVGAFRFYEEAFGVKFAAACYDNLKRYGHLGAIDVFANLEAGVSTGEFRSGDLVMVMNNSPAAAWSSFLLRV